MKQDVIGTDLKSLWSNSQYEYPPNLTPVFGEVL